MAKVFKMILVKELKKLNQTEVTPRTTTDPETSGLETVRKMTNGLVNQEELVNLFEESEKCESKEAKYVLQISKLESDLQAKIYDLNGNFDLDKAIEDAHYFNEELSQEIIPQIKNASDGFILYDRHYYEDDLFKTLSEEIQNLK